MINKVQACITRHKNGHLQLLVFDHRDAPEAGTQVPAGTVEAGEAIEAAVRREVLEEAGLAGIALMRKLAEHRSAEGTTVRHVFHLIMEHEAPDSWSHGVQGKGEDAGMIFDYRWIELAPHTVLAGNQHAWLDRLLNPLP